MYVFFFFSINEEELHLISVFLISYIKKFKIKTKKCTIYFEFSNEPSYCRAYLRRFYC